MKREVKLESRVNDRFLFLKNPLRGSRPGMILTVLIGISNGGDTSR